jgi:hypothetical protein
MDENGLLELCRASSGAGQRFEAVWHEVLEHHPLVAGWSVRPALGETVLVALVSGRRLEFDERSHEWRLRG